MAEGGQTGVHKYFFFIKENVSSNWKDLAFHLDFRRSDIDNIAGRNRDDKSCCMDLLEEWLKCNGKGATIEVLVKALSEAKLQSTVDGLKNKYHDLERRVHVSEEVDRVAAKYNASVEAAIFGITQQVEKLNRELTATAENCEQVEKEIQQHYKRLISKLQLEEQEMLTNVQKVNRDRGGELTQEKEKLETELENKKEDLKFCRKISDCKGDTGSLILQQIEERFKKFSLEETGNRSLVAHTKVSFHPCSLSQVSGGTLSVFAGPGSIQGMENFGNELTATGGESEPSSQSQVSPGSLSESVVGFTIDVQEPAVESLSSSVTVTTNNADLTGGEVAPQIEVTSPQGKTTLIQTTAHTSPPLAAGKVQTSRLSRVWGAEWRPQESGKHTLGVCMGGLRDLGPLTVNVASNNPVLRVGEEGSNQGQFDRPLDVAVRGDRLYVADYFNSRVQVFDLSGTFCHSFPTANPVGLAVQTDGTIVMHSWTMQGGEVKKFSPSGELLHEFPLGKYCTEPYSLAVQRNGRVVVADKGKHSIFLFDADGTLVKQVGGKGEGKGQFAWPWFVCVDKEDSIIVADQVNDRVQVFDKNLNYKHKFGQKGRQPQDMWAPHGLSADSRGNIVLANIGGETDNGMLHSVKLQVFRPDGTWVSTISSDGDKLNLPYGVAVTEDGHVFVADYNGNCIRKYRYM